MTPTELFSRLRPILHSRNQRTAKAQKNIAGSLVLKVVSILISLQVVPLTIDYLSPETYGIWLTVSSMVAWLAYFNLGFSGGFRNQFTKSLAEGNVPLARKYLSTTYAALGTVFSILMVATLLVNHYFLDWAQILNLPAAYSGELKPVFALLVVFFCVNIVGEVFYSMLQADQSPAWASLYQTLGQALALAGILILTSTPGGGLYRLAWVVAGVPCIWLIGVSFFNFRFHRRYHRFAPAWHCVRRKLVRNILSLGLQFFLIMVSMLLIFQLINILLTRELGPLAAAQYNIAFKYFSILNMGFAIILQPLWPAFTDAFTQKDFGWMNSIRRKLERLWLLCIPAVAVMVLCSGWVYKIWIKDSIEVPLSLSVAMAVFILCSTLGNAYMYMINGTGKLRLQLTIYTCFAVIAVPTMIGCCKLWGTEGILIIPSVVFLTQAAFGRIQLKRLTTGQARGIWNK